jgi:hypothetical protein
VPPEVAADFTCRAFYTDGTDSVVAPDTWELTDCDGIARISKSGRLTAEAVFSERTCQLQATYTENGITQSADAVAITIKAVHSPLELIVDDDDDSATASGTWYATGVSSPYGYHSHYSYSKGAAYTFEADLYGRYEIYLWWTFWPNRCQQVPVTICETPEQCHTVDVNQRTDWEQWNSLGVFDFSGSASVTVTAKGGCSTCADAVRFVKVADPLSEEGDLAFRPVPLPEILQVAN